MPNNDIKISYMDIAKLKPNPGNPNRHPKEQIDRLAEILRYQGFRQPIVVSIQSGFIVTGHGRLEAAKKLKLSKIPVSYQDFDSPEQEFAYMVADNSIALWAEMDLSQINVELPDLDPSFDIDLLGIKDFTLDLSEKDYELEEEKNSYERCPSCGTKF